MRNLRTIQFNEMTQEQQLALGHLFLKNKEKKVFEPGEYTVEIDKVTYQFRIDNRIIRRQRASNPTEERFEIQGDYLGSGAFGDVYKVLGTLAPQYDKSVKFKNRTRRVMKVQKHAEKHNPIENLFREVVMTKSVKDLHIKEPVVVDDVSYTVMWEAVGDELFKIVDDESKNKLFLSVEDRFAITLETLYAIERMHEFGVIHNDLKLENAKYNSKNRQVKLFDFGLSKFKYEEIFKILGTPVCMSPEQLTGQSTTELSDAYTACLMIAPIWGATNLREQYRGSTHELIHSIKANITKPQLNFESRIFRMLSLGVLKWNLMAIFLGMTAFQLEGRKSIPEAIAEFEMLRLNYMLNKYQSVNKDMIKHAHDEGLKVRNLSHANWDEVKKQIRSSLEVLLLDEDSHNASVRKAAYLEFGEMTRIKALRNLDSYQAIEEKLDAMSKRILDGADALSKYISELEDYAMTTHVSPKIDRRGISHLIKEIEYVIDKHKKYAVSLDGMEIVSQRYEDEIQSLEKHPLIINIRKAPEDERQLKYAKQELRYTLTLFTAEFLPDMSKSAQEEYAKENYENITAEQVQKSTLSPAQRQDVTDILSIIHDASDFDSMLEDIQARLKKAQRGFFGRSKLEDTVVASIKDIKQSIQQSMQSRLRKNNI